MNSNSYSETAYSKKAFGEMCKADKERIKIVLNLIGTGKKVLDLGSVGSFGGEISFAIQKNGNQVSAADASGGFSAQYSEAGIDFKKTNLEMAFPFESDFFDVVYAGEIIEHLADTDNFLTEIKRVLKKDGFLVITTPNVVSLGRRIKILLGQNAFFEASFSFTSGVAGHLRYFTFGLLKDLLYFHGFRVETRCSETVSLASDIHSSFLAKIFPYFGRSIIIKAAVVK